MPDFTGTWSGDFDLIKMGPDAGANRITIISPSRLESCFTDNGIVSSCGIIERQQ